jgi:exosortase
MRPVREQNMTIETMRDAESEIRKKHAAFAAFVAVSGLVFWKTLSTLLAYSLSRESSSHIILIPFVSLYLLYSERTRIFASTGTSFGPAIGLIGTGLAIYSFAAWHVYPHDGNGLLPAATFSLVLLWLGGFVLFYGTQAARTGAFALLFLLLMVPPPDGILDRVVYLLQEGSTDNTYVLFRMLSVPVLRQGFFLSVPGVTIEVAQECSGIRSSLALFITCLLAAHLFLRTTWRQAFFALLALPLAIIKNAIRIATLTLLSVYVDPRFLTGRLHREGGIVFFLLVLAILAPILRLLQKSEGRLASGNLESDVRAKKEFAREI